MSKIQPLADRVLVQPAAAEEKTVGGIIIPDSAKEKPLRGTVLAVGNGTKDEPQAGRPGPLRQIRRHRTGVRGREIPDHQAARRAGGHSIV